MPSGFSARVEIERKTLAVLRLDIPVTSGIMKSGIHGIRRPRLRGGLRSCLPTMDLTPKFRIAVKDTIHTESFPARFRGFLGVLFVKLHLSGCSFFAF